MNNIYKKKTELKMNDKNVEEYNFYSSDHNKMKESIYEEISLEEKQIIEETKPIFLDDWNIEEENRILRIRKLSSYKNINKSFKEIIRKGICNLHRSEIYLFLTEMNQIYEEMIEFYDDIVRTKSTPNYPDIIALFGYPDYELFNENEYLLSHLTIIKNQNPEISFSPLIPAVTSILSKFFQPNVIIFTIQTMINKNDKYFTKTKHEFIMMLETIENFIHEHDKKIYNRSKFLNLTISEIALYIVPFLISKRINKNVALTIFDDYVCEGRKALIQYTVGIISSLQHKLLIAPTALEFVNIIFDYIKSLEDPNELKKLIQFTFNLKYVKRKKIHYLEHHQQPKNGDYLSLRIGSQLPNVDDFYSQLRLSPMLSSSNPGIYTYHGNHRKMRISINQVVNSCIHNGKLLTITQFENLRVQFHSKLRRYDAYPVYLMSKDGSSLFTFFQKSKNCNPSMIIIKTTSKTIGAVFDDCIEVKLHQNYYGSPLATVFDVTNNKIYKSTLKNDYYLSVQRDSISIGGGNTGCAIYLADPFQTVISDPCESFNSPSLLPSQKVPVIDIELYKLDI